MRLRIVSICAFAALWSSSAPTAEPPAAPSRFVTARQCIACHTQLTTPSGEDVSIGFDWRATMMANAARDPYWHAAVRREVLDHPAAQAAIEDKCSTCHMPMARFDSAAAGGRGEVFANLAPTAPQHLLAADGVSCTVCHQIADEKLGEHASFDGGFAIAVQNGDPVAFGPHEIDAGRQWVMRSAADVGLVIAGILYAVFPIGTGIGTGIHFGLLSMDDEPSLRNSPKAAGPIPVLVAIDECAGTAEDFSPRPGDWLLCLGLHRIAASWG